MTLHTQPPLIKQSRRSPRFTPRTVTRCLLPLKKLSFRCLQRRVLWNSVNHSQHLSDLVVLYSGALRGLSPTHRALPASPFPMVCVVSHGSLQWLGAQQAAWRLLLLPPSVAPPPAPTQDWMSWSSGMSVDFGKS